MAVSHGSAVTHGPLVLLTLICTTVHSSERLWPMGLWLSFITVLFAFV